MPAMACMACGPQWWTLNAHAQALWWDEQLNRHPAVLTLALGRRPGMQRVEVAVVGAGVVGLAVARALALAGREVIPPHPYVLSHS